MDQADTKRSGGPTSEGAPTEAALRALLYWYADMGVDECVSAEAANFFTDFPDTAPLPTTPAPARNRGPRTQPSAQRAGSQPKTSQATGMPSGRSGQMSNSPSERPTTGVIRPDNDALSTEEAIIEAKRLAAAATDIPALEAAIRGFNGCSLKKGARHTVVADGTAGAPLLIMGEAPGRDEDREGKPFVGRAGLLLDKMLAAIDHDRQKNAYISNVIYWRPPGNRTPSAEEMMICQPFADRLIDLAKPKIVMIAGAAPLKALLNKTGIMKTRGKWQTLTTETGFFVPVMPTFHPAYLLRNPKAKRLVWQDLQALSAKLREI